MSPSNRQFRDALLMLFRGGNAGNLVLEVVTA